MAYRIDDGGGGGLEVCIQGCLCYAIHFEAAGFLTSPSFVVSVIITQRDVTCTPRL